MEGSGVPPTPVLLEVGIFRGICGGSWKVCGTVQILKFTPCKFAKGCNDMISVNQCGFSGLDRGGLLTSGGLALCHLGEQNFSVMHRKICFVINFFNGAEAKAVERLTNDE
jgi:hypothetical protein